MRARRNLWREAASPEYWQRSHLMRRHPEESQLDSGVMRDWSFEPGQRFRKQSSAPVRPMRGLHLLAGSAPEQAKDS